MLSLNDIINASFRKSGFSGYRTEDVDKFIDEVKESYDLLVKKGIEQKEESEKQKTENTQLLEKIKILAAKVEDYRQEEDEIKNALVSAQKLGDASVREARHKAEIIIKDANLKAERIISAANQEIAEQKKELDRLQQSVNDFRSKLLAIYKEHLTLIDALPTTRKPEAEEPAKPVAPVSSEPVEDKPVAEETQPVEEAIEEEAADPLFRAQVSSFDDMKAFETAAADRYTAIQFGDESDISDDINTPEGI